MTDLDLLGRFFAAWSEPDLDARAEILTDCLTHSATYADPQCPVPVIGPDAIAEMLSVFCDRMPGTTARPITDPRSHNGFLYCTIGFFDQGKQMMSGQYFARRDGDQLDLIVGFPDTGKET